MAAGLATLELLDDPDFYPSLFERTQSLAEGLAERARASGLPLAVNHVGSMFGLFFTEAARVTNYQQVMACDLERFNRFFHAMLARSEERRVGKARRCRGSRQPAKRKR